MKQKYILISAILCLGKLQADAQNFARVFHQPVIRDDTSQNQAITFVTMESVRHGMSGALKGVQVRIQHSPCEEVPSAVVFSNSSGEPWRYEIFSASGAKYAEGATGYDRIIALKDAGRYLIKFKHAGGLEAFDELNVEQQEPLAASMLMDSSAPFSPGDPIKFSAATSSGNELTWEMGDGKVYHDQQQIQHAYNLPGQYTVRLTARRGSCEKQVTSIIKVNAREVAGNSPE
jgi:hypothetical protein